MELVYFYIGSSPLCFVQNCGFHFSSKYRFRVEDGNQRYVLKQEKSRIGLPENFFDETGCVTNITAVVGENGSGKTTLLKQLFYYDYRNKIERHWAEEHDNYYFEAYEKSEIIVVYKKDDHLVCFHNNIDNFRNETDAEDLSASAEKNTLNNSGRISTVCLTNSMYGMEDELLIGETISKININVNALSMLARKFYQSKRPGRGGLAGGYYEFQDTLCRSKTTREFQQVMDVLYLQYIGRNDIESILTGSIQSDLQIWFQTYRKYLPQRRGSISKEDEREKGFEEFFHTLEQYLQEEHMYQKGKINVFTQLYINLLFEILLYQKVDVCNRGVLPKDKQELKDLVCSSIKHMKEGRINSYTRYFIEALEEIEEYESKLLEWRDPSRVTGTQEKSGGPAVERLQFGSDSYQVFLRLVEKSALGRPYSYVLSYLEIGGLRLASGERALLNFFSWLHMALHFAASGECRDRKNDYLNENVLLLIDEIDLYCHPSWQQKLVYYLIRETAAQYQDKKVQIIFTTHSPIVLSDIPRSNIIFLRNKEGSCVVEEGLKREETFGANIYKLFDDAFFLREKGQIGEFSKRKIQGIIDKIKPLIDGNGENTGYPELEEEEILCLKQEIALIGERFLRDKLFEMLYKCQYRNLGRREKRIRIYEEKIRELKEEITYDQNLLSE